MLALDLSIFLCSDYFSTLNASDPAIRAASGTAFLRMAASHFTMSFCASSTVAGASNIELSQSDCVR